MKLKAALKLTNTFAVAACILATGALWNAVQVNERLDQLSWALGGLHTANESQRSAGQQGRSEVERLATVGSLLMARVTALEERIRSYAGNWVTVWSGGVL